MTAIKEIPSPNKTHITGKRIVDLIVLHTIEDDETPSAAEGTGAYFQKTSTKASSHYGFDNNSICRYVQDNDVAWAAPGANHDGIQFEHAGRAGQTKSGWDDAYSKAMLVLSAEVAGRLVKKYNLPIRFLRANDLTAGKRGFTYHAEVSRAYKLSNHTDPGTSFPIEDYLARVKKVTGANPPAQDLKKVPPTLRKGSTGWRVKQVQRLLNAATALKNTPWNTVKVDGIYGDGTRQAVVLFQTWAHLKHDGVCGPATWHALWSAFYLGDA